MSSITSRRKAGNGFSLVLYLIRSENGLTKIGIATDAVDRLRTLDVGSPVGLSLEYFIYTIWATDIEKALHRQYRDKRVKGEWYKLSDNDVRDIQSIYGECGTISSYTPESV